MPRTRHTGSRIALALVAAAGAARAQVVSGLIEEDVAQSRIDTTDQVGNTQRLEALLFTQRYRLNVDQAFYPNLRLLAGGTLEQILGDAVSAGQHVDQYQRRYSLFGNLNVGTPMLGGIAGYTRRETSAAGLSASWIYDEPALFLTWKPSELPWFSLRVSRPWTRDSARQTEDLATLQSLFITQYAPIPHLNLRYTLDYSAPDDRVHHTQTKSLMQVADMSWAENLTPWRTSVATGLNASFRRTRIDAAGTGAVQVKQLFPVTGFSAVEVFPATATSISLSVNPGLTDANLGAGAGINLGFSVSLAGDDANRHLGVQFADAVTGINTVFVWVDRQIPQTVAQLFTWTAYKSDDNVRWTQVAVVAPVEFQIFENRFEITIERTAARFVKVVTRPLAPAATTDPALRDILVTEVQTYTIDPVTRSSGWETSNAETLTGSLRTQLLDRDDLAYDFSVYATRIEEPTRLTRTWTVANGITFNRKLGPILLANARVARQDFDQARGHESALLYSASLSADELPTLGHTLAYSGQTNFVPEGTSSINSVSFFNRATPYRNVGLQAGDTLTLSTDVAGLSTRTNVLTVTSALQPNPRLTLGFNYALSMTRITGAGRPTTNEQAQRLEGLLSFNPFPTLYLSGNLARTFLGDGRAYTLASGALGFSPLQGGALQLSFGFNETLDPSGALTRLIAPSLRWNVNRSIVLTVTYAVIDTDGGVEEIRQRTFHTNLRITL